MFFGLIIAAAIGIKVYYYQIEYSIALDVDTHSRFLEALEKNQVEDFIGTSCRGLPTSLKILKNLENKLFGVDLKDTDGEFILSIEKRVYKQLSNKGICNQFITN
jgi:hypothetical protein